MKRILPALPLLLLALPACVPMVAAGGATVGVAAAQEGGVKGAVTDKGIYLTINDGFARSKNPLFRKIDVQVREGRVLLAGSVPNPDMRVEAVRIAWSADGVKQVINEIKADGEGGGVGNYMTDTWITGNIKARLALDRDIQSINYTVDTVDGTVYVMGVAQDQQELNRALQVARSTKFVKSVVNYTRLRGETPAGVQSPTDNTKPAPLVNGNSSAGTGAGSGSGGFETSTNAAQDNAVQAAPLK
jgi:osmotically-inducible protein OsmY